MTTHTISSSLPVEKRKPLDQKNKFCMKTNGGVLSEQTEDCNLQIVFSDAVKSPVLEVFASFLVH